MLIVMDSVQSAQEAILLHRRQVEGVDAIVAEQHTKPQRRAGKGLPSWYRAALIKHWMREGACLCEYCGVLLTTQTVQVDHRKPIAKGGSNDPANLYPACKSCNNRKRWLQDGRGLRDYLAEKALCRARYYRPYRGVWSWAPLPKRWRDYRDAILDHALTGRRRARRARAS